MHRFKNILVCFDLLSNEEALLARATDLGGRTGARLTLLHVVEEYPFGSYGVLSDDERQQLKDEYTHYNFERLDRMAEPALRKDVDVDIRVAAGKPLVQILRHAVGGEYDLVMTGADHQRRVGEMLFGGTTTRLLRSCPVPVWVVKSDHGGHYTHVLAAVDLQLGEEEEVSPLDARIVDLARSVATAEKAELHVAHVCQTWIPYGEVDPGTQRHGRRLIDAARWRLERLGKALELGDRAAHVHLLEGAPAREIHKLVGEQGVELVVMGTIGRTGIKGLLTGNTAERVLKRIDCSLLAVKPEGFVCPIKIDDPDRG